ncbi:zinc finger MYM-type protein 1-like [Penaeus indicus]|uniref:zinc finger MYM-type protein 1-like n=1 Tax=Penaeus indicus TaxID=29960 RepID=UPI00300C6B5B
MDIRRFFKRVSEEREETHKADAEEVSTEVNRSTENTVFWLRHNTTQHRHKRHLKQIVAVTSMLGAQGLPFRGHDESAESTNRCNFLACMELLMTFDPFLQNHNPPSNATYTSPVSQNEMIECCAQEVTSAIVSEITRSKKYSIMADEARDGRSEQLAVCVRYVSEGEVKERFLALSELMSFDAQSIADKLQEQLQISGFAHVKCVAQTYDGAAVISGPIGGVQAGFRRLHPIYTAMHMSST